MVWKSEEGVVTAELMALVPAVIIAISAMGWLLSLLGQQLALEQDLTYLLRLHLIGEPFDVAAGLSVQPFNRGRLSCLMLEKPGLITLRSEQCGIAIA